MTHVECKRCGERWSARILEVGDSLSTHDCVRLGYRCNAQMTSEDMRCNLCRSPGCNAVTFTATPEDVPVIDGRLAGTHFQVGPIQLVSRGAS